MKRSAPIPLRRFYESRLAPGSMSNRAAPRRRHLLGSGALAPLWQTFFVALRIPRDFRSALLSLEAIGVFLGVPALFATRYSISGWLLPALWVSSAVCWAWLRWLAPARKRGPARPMARRIFARFLVLGALMLVLVALMFPEDLFDLPRKKPGLWTMVMIGYPVLSVVPQEIIFRRFFFVRYHSIFPGRWTMIVASAVAFGFAHVVLRNEIAVVLSAVGGLLFGHTYSRAGSLRMPVLEHALFGCLIFTVGLGQFFYSGSVSVFGP